VSEINISILSRILEPYLQEHTEEAANVQVVLQAANGDEQNTNEDDTLTDSEAQRFVDRQREQAQTLRQRLSVISSRRDALVGSLQSAETTLRNANAGEDVLALVRQIAGQDNDAQNISLPELQNAIQELEQTLQASDQLNATEFFSQVQSLVQQYERLEQRNPEVFLPQTEAAQRAPIRLDFLKFLEEGDWRQMEDLQARSNRGEPLGERNAQNGFYVAAITLLETAHIDWHHRTDGWLNTAGDWRLSFENLQAALRAMPPRQGEEAPVPEMEMAMLRYAADQAQQDMGRMQGERLLAHPDRTNLGISFNPLLHGNQAVFHDFPVLDLYRNELGSDGVLTMPELMRSLNHYYAPHYEQMPSAQEVMNELRVLVTAQTPAPVAADAVGARTRDSYINEMNRLVLADLVRMREGFTERDTQLVTDMPIDNLMELGTNIVTLGGWTTGGRTYVDVQRGFVDVHDASRGRALDSLRRLIEHPERATDFQAWLSHRHGAEAQVSIPNALAFLGTYDPAAVATLNGPFFQATRLWNIRQTGDANAQARAWLSLASDLRTGYRGDVASLVHKVPNLAFARAILASLRRESTDVGIRREARIAFQDSMGYDIEDDNGQVHGLSNQGNGEFGMWPVDWFRNYSDEGVAGAPAEVALVAASLTGGGSVFRLGKGLMSVAGRRAILAGLGEFVGVRSTMMALGETAVGTSSVAGQGIFGRAMSSWISRRVATAEAAVSTATTAAERNLARASLARARNIRQILTSPAQALADTGAAGRIAVGAGRGVGRVLSYPLRGASWLVNEGIIRYGISSYFYNHYLRPHRAPLIFDREFRLDLSSLDPTIHPGGRN